MGLLQTSAIGILVLMLRALLPQTDLPFTDRKGYPAPTQQAALKGAWRLTSGTLPFAEMPKGATSVTLLEDGYFTVAVFDTVAPKFIGTYGGSFSTENGKLTQHIAFNTFDSTTVGTSRSLTYTLQNNHLRVTDDGQQGKQQTWSLADKPNTSSSPLEGTWRITGRAGDDGTISPMQRGPRKTLKILSGNRFQWIAFNTETRQFSGTGGGTYTAENGQYTEHIDFFSRDPKRVGASLPFNFEVQDGKWLHSGQSSTGKPIHEVWEREQ